jgi:hypothetical protein
MARSSGKDVRTALYSMMHDHISCLVASEYTLTGTGETKQFKRLEIAKAMQSKYHIHYFLN